MALMKPLVLTGMMGSGKTSIGRYIAGRLGFVFVDIDSEIEKSEKKTISDIFEQNGEEYFREIEAYKIKKTVDENFVISLGGGAFENEETRDFLLANSNVVYLKTSPNEILNRIKNSVSRPLLKDNMNLDRIRELINIRENNYTKAHYTVNTDSKSIEKIAEEIIKWQY